MADRFPLILNTSNNQIQEIASGDQLDLSGNNVANAGIITATTFSGNLTGNVTGNINGNLTGTLQTVAQPNITSLGTLSSLNVSGNASIGGVLTYEDVTNVDSVGLVTARDGIFLPDLKQLKLGNTAASPDLEIYHSSSNYIDSKTGHLYLRAGGGNIYINAVNNETAISAIANAQVELFYNNSKVFETRNAGCTITGGLTCGGATFSGAVNVPDNYVFSLGNSNDLQLYHNGSNSYISNRGAGALVIEATTGEGGIILTQNGSVALKHDNNLRLETTSSGVALTGNLELGDNERIVLGDAGTSDSHIRWDTSHLQIASAGQARFSCSGLSVVNLAGTETQLVTAENGGVDLYYDNVKRFETTNQGINVTGHSELDNVNVSGTLTIAGVLTANNTVRVADNVYCYFGTGSDLSIRHDASGGNHSYIFNHGAGVLKIGSDTQFLIGKTSNETYIEANPDGAVKLYHDNSVRIETLAEGAKVKRHSGGATTLYIEGAEGGNAILDMFADDGDDNQDKFRLTATTGGVFFLQNYANGGWQNNIGSTGAGSVDLYHNNTKRLETTSSGAKITGDLTLNHSSNSTDVTGYAVQRIWAPTISAGNVYKCGQWYEGEGAIQLLISVRSVTGGHSGSATYLFQGGYASIGGQGTKRLLPLASGRGHGDNADTGMNSNAWEVLIDNINDYTYAVYIHVPSGRTGKVLQVSVTENNRGNTFTDLSSTVAYSSISSQVSTPALTSLQTSHAEVVRQHLLPAFKVGRGGSDQNVNTGDAIKFNQTSGSTQFFNRGNHYNSSTGYFTAPYAGVYHFYALIIFEQVGENTDMTDSWDFYQNSTQIAFSARRAKYRGDYTGTSGYFTDPATVTTYMNAGDYVWCRNKYNSKVIHSNPTYSYFCGHFCG